MKYTKTSTRRHRNKQSTYVKLLCQFVVGNILSACMWPAEHNLEWFTFYSIFFNDVFLTGPCRPDLLKLVCQKLCACAYVCLSTLKQILEIQKLSLDVLNEAVYTLDWRLRFHTNCFSYGASVRHWKGIIGVWL